MHKLLIIRLLAQDLREYLLENDPGDYEAEMEKFWSILKDEENT